MELEVGGVFIFVGFEPNSNLLGVHVDHDAAGYILTDRDMGTSVEGLWAVGDVRAQLTKQIATAVGDGTTAAVAASQYISHRRDRERQGGPAAPDGSTKDGAAPRVEPAVSYSEG